VIPGSIVARRKSPGGCEEQPVGDRPDMRGQGFDFSGTGHNKPEPKGILFHRGHGNPLQQFYDGSGILSMSSCTGFGLNGKEAMERVNDKIYLTACPGSEKIDRGRVCLQGRPFDQFIEHGCLIKRPVQEAPSFRKKESHFS
jgi:hypothetical protein